MHVAKEMERDRYSQLPLLIGGATTSKAHTAVKIAPAYGQRRCMCWTRLAPSVSWRNLINDRSNGELFAETDAAQITIASGRHARSVATKILLHVSSEARSAGYRSTGSRRYSDARVHGPSRASNEFPLRRDSCPISTGHPFSIPGNYGDAIRHFRRCHVGPKAKELFEDAQTLLERNRPGEAADRARRLRLFPGQ